jgi:hypothetical protein
MENFLKCPLWGEHSIDYLATEMCSSEVKIEVFCTKKGCSFEKEKTILIEDFLTI